MPAIKAAAINAVQISFEQRIAPTVNDQVHQLSHYLNEQAPAWLQELVPAYHSVMVYFDVLKASHDEVIAAVRAVLSNDQWCQPLQPGQLHQIEVCYAPEVAPDLARVCAATGLSAAQVAELHSSPEYRVYALGFAPQFAYLGDVNPALHVPRLDTPRQRVPQGSVAIALQQTAIYPQASPGGWNLIGRASSWPQLAPNDRVQFQEISLAEYQQRQHQ